MEIEPDGSDKRFTMEALLSRLKFYFIRDKILDKSSFIRYTTRDASI